MRVEVEGRGKRGNKRAQSIQGQKSIPGQRERYTNIWAGGCTIPGPLLSPQTLRLLAESDHTWTSSGLCFIEQASESPKVLAKPGSWGSPEVFWAKPKNVNFQHAPKCCCCCWSFGLESQTFKAFMSSCCSKCDSQTTGNAVIGNPLDMQNLRAEEMAQWLRAFVTLSEDSG